MGKRLAVTYHRAFAYDIVFEQDFSKLAYEMKALSLDSRKICIVTDTKVSKLYLQAVKSELEKIASKVVVFEFHEGEESKNLDTARFAYEKLVIEKFERKDLLVALGGGVVGDLTGFVAATFLRGISFIQIPTTLLSQVDSSIGGKTGVDFDSYKNMVGAFHMPVLVYVNISTLKTLNKREFSSGMGEVIKHGLIRDRSYLDFIEEHRDEILSMDLEILTKLVYRSALIKKAVVEEDPMEEGLRGILNYGHTLGHAIEKYKQFKRSHGACVALGMLCALYIGLQNGEIRVEEIERIKQLYHVFHLPLGDEFVPKKVLEYAKHDKKAETGRIKFILLRSLGDAYISTSVDETSMLMALEKVGGNCIDEQKQFT